MKVQQFHNKNQFIISGNGELTFQSYNSTIATIDCEGFLALFSDWNYSQTTQKHLYLFLQEYKNCLNDCVYNNLINSKNNIYNSKNKQALLQKLIDKKIIKYKEC